MSKLNDKCEDIMGYVADNYGATIVVGGTILILIGSIFLLYLKATR